MKQFILPLLCWGWPEISSDPHQWWWLITTLLMLLSNKKNNWQCCSISHPLHHCPHNLQPINHVPDGAIPTTPPHQIMPLLLNCALQTIKKIIEHWIMMGIFNLTSHGLMSVLLLWIQTEQTLMVMILKKMTTTISAIDSECCPIPNKDWIIDFCGCSSVPITRWICMINYLDCDLGGKIVAGSNKKNISNRKENHTVQWKHNSTDIDISPHDLRTKHLRLDTTVLDQLKAVRITY